MNAIGNQERTSGFHLLLPLGPLRAPRTCIFRPQSWGYGGTQGRLKEIGADPCGTAVAEARPAWFGVPTPEKHSGALRSSELAATITASAVHAGDAPREGAIAAHQQADAALSGGDVEGLALAARVGGAQ